MSVMEEPVVGSSLGAGAGTRNPTAQRPVVTWSVSAELTV